LSNLDRANLLVRSRGSGAREHLDLLGRAGGQRMRRGVPGNELRRYSAATEKCRYDQRTGRVKRMGPRSGRERFDCQAPRGTTRSGAASAVNPWDPRDRTARFGDDHQS
jgi:hypothetical protein